VNSDSDSDDGSDNDVSGISNSSHNNNDNVYDDDDDDDDDNRSLTLKEVNIEYASNIDTLNNNSMLNMMSSVTLNISNPYFTPLTYISNDSDANHDTGENNKGESYNRSYNSHNVESLLGDDSLHFESSGNDNINGKKNDSSLLQDANIGHSLTETSLMLEALEGGSIQKPMDTNANRRRSYHEGKIAFDANRTELFLWGSGDESHDYDDDNVDCRSRGGDNIIVPKSNTEGRESTTSKNIIQKELVSEELGKIVITSSRQFLNDEKQPMKENRKSASSDDGENTHHLVFGGNEFRRRSSTTVQWKNTSGKGNDNCS